VQSRIPKGSYENAIPVHLRPDGAADYLGISKSKLAKMRMRGHRGEGPPFIKVAGCILYRRSDLDDWLAAHLVEQA
jgi:Helix-turn-helix domain